MEEPIKSLKVEKQNKKAKWWIDKSQQQLGERGKRKYKIKGGKGTKEINSNFSKK